MDMTIFTSKNDLFNTLLKIAEVPEENRTPEQIKSYNQSADMLNYLYGVHIKGNNTLMSINAAIQYMRQAAQEQNDAGDFYTVKVSNKDIADECYHYAKEFNQIADWLEELQQVKNGTAKGFIDLDKIIEENKVSYEN